MGEFLDTLKYEAKSLLFNKKSLINLLILSIIILSLYLFINLRQSQIIKSRAAADPIVFVADDNVSQKSDGTWVAKKPQVPIKFTSPSFLGPPGVTCVVKGPAAAKTGDPVNFTATATGFDKNIKMVDIYVRRPGTTGLTASDFVQIGNNTACDSITCSVTGTYAFYTAGTPIVHCNAYYQTQYTGNKADECTGNKPGVDKAGSGWSDCGPESRMPVTVTGNTIPEPTPLPTPAPATFSCTVTGPTTAATGTEVTFSATATGAGNKLIKMVDIYVRKPNTSGTTGADFIQIANNTACNASACSVSGNYTFTEAYNAQVHCNAYYQTQYTGIPADECTGNPAGSPDRWSDCGPKSLMSVAVAGGTGSDE